LHRSQNHGSEGSLYQQGLLVVASQRVCPRVCLASSLVEYLEFFDSSLSPKLLFAAVLATYVPRRAFVLGIWLMKTQITPQLSIKSFH
jgi:hypothetical protein